MIKVANDIIKDIPSYTVICTTSPLSLVWEAPLSSTIALFLETVYKIYVNPAIAFPNHLHSFFSFIFRGQKLSVYVDSTPFYYNLETRKHGIFRSMSCPTFIFGIFDKNIFPLHFPIRYCILNIEREQPLACG